MKEGGGMREREEKRKKRVKGKGLEQFPTYKSEAFI